MSDLTLFLDDLPLSVETLMLAAVALAALLTLVNLGLVFALRRQIRSLREEHGAWHKRLDKEVALSSPTRAAIAAVIATSRDKPLTLEQFQQEMTALIDQWDEIEALAEKAEGQLADLVDDSEGAAPAPQTASGRGGA